jgi:DtxR family Mn-dependent transcriptional regulator
MTDSSPGIRLTRSLEDYLETIHELQRDGGEVRVRDIAAARGVKAGSVSPALRRLAELGLVDYAQREHIGLSQRGAGLARRIYARHHLLELLFQDVLLLAPQDAEPVACAMEHSLSPAAMDRLARFLEYLEVQDEAEGFLAGFHEWLDKVDGAAAPLGPQKRITLAQLQRGQRARVLRVQGRGEQRRGLLDMGILPDVELQVLRGLAPGQPLSILLHGFAVELDEAQARAVRVEPVAA